MAKPRTPEEFSRIVVSDFTWRLRELSSLKLAVSSANPIDRPAFIRATVVMCYAHWEGHAKFCGEKFIDFLTMRRLRFSELKPRYYEVRFLREIGSSHSLNYLGRLELVSRIMSSAEDRFSYFPRDLIDTRSNLNSSVLGEMCLVCGVDPAVFHDEFDFIDRLLLKRRNEVAHGEAVFIEAVDVDELVHRTTKIMRIFRDELDNAVTLSAYKAVA